MKYFNKIEYYCTIYFQYCFGCTIMNSKYNLPQLCTIIYKPCNILKKGCTNLFLILYMLYLGHRASSSRRGRHQASLSPCRFLEDRQRHSRPPPARDGSRRRTAVPLALLGKPTRTRRCLMARAAAAARRRPMTQVKHVQY